MYRGLQIPVKSNGIVLIVATSAGVPLCLLMAACEFRHVCVPLLVHFRQVAHQTHVLIHTHVSLYANCVTVETENGMKTPWRNQCIQVRLTAANKPAAIHACISGTKKTRLLVGRVWVEHKPIVHSKEVT